MTPEEPTTIHLSPAQRRKPIDYTVIPPDYRERASVVTLRVWDVVTGLAVVTLLALGAGYTLGLGEANAIALRAEAAAIDAEATLAQARALCGGAL